jgi:hypothetical protein
MHGINVAPEPLCAGSRPQNIFSTLVEKDGQESALKPAHPYLQELQLHMLTQLFNLRAYSIRI